MSVILLTITVITICLIFHRLSQARAMPGLSTWLKSKSIKPTSVVMMIRPDLWSSSFLKGGHEAACVLREKTSVRSSGRAGQSSLLILPV